MRASFSYPQKAKGKENNRPSSVTISMPASTSAPASAPASAPTSAPSSIPASPQQSAPNSAPPSPLFQPKYNTRNKAGAHWQSRQETFSFRRRKYYDAWNPRDYLCPKPNYRQFINQLDEVLSQEYHLNQERTKLDLIIGKIYRDRGMEPPGAEEDLFYRQKYYYMVRNAYYEIRRRIRQDSEIHKKDPHNFDVLIASLEVVGAIILNPLILTRIQFTYGDELFVRPWTYVNFVSDWTGKIITKISFPTDQAGLCFHLKTEANIIQLCHNGDYDYV